MFCDVNMDLDKDAQHISTSSHCPIDIIKEEGLELTLQPTTRGLTFRG